VRPIDRLTFWTAAALLAGAVLVRLPSLASPPLDFAAMRQHHSALIARAIFLNQHPTAAPAWQRDTANDYVAQATIPEPLVVERMAAAMYEATGVERLQLARWVAVLCWFVGAWCLFAAARQSFGDIAGLCALTVALFLPYTIGASSSIQPDTLAFLLMSAALFGWTSDKVPAAVLLSMFAVFVRPMAAFWLVPVGAVVLRRNTDTDRSPWWRVVATALVIVAPAVAYVSYRAANDSSMSARIGATLAPGLWGSLQYWRGWAGLAWRAFGVLFVAGAIAPIAIRSGRERTWLWAMWIGYAAYGFLFNLHVSTHPYYQTLAVPMIAISVGAVASRVASLVRPAFAVALPATLTAGLVVVGIQSGVLRPSPHANDVRVYQAIGERVNHSRRLVFLASDWGVPLRYYGAVAGRYWPARFEIEMYRPLGADGIVDTGASNRLTQFSRDVGGAEYFIVTDQNELARQPDLAALLAARPVIERTNDFVIYDLRSASAGGKR